MTRRRTPDAIVALHGALERFVFTSSPIEGRIKHLPSLLATAREPSPKAMTTSSIAAGRALDALDGRRRSEQSAAMGAILTE